MSDTLCYQVPCRGGRIYYKEFFAPANETHNRFDELCVVRVISGSTAWQIGDECLTATAGDLIFLNNLESRRRLSVSADLQLAAFSFPVSFLSAADAMDCLRPFYARGASFTHRLCAPRLHPFYDAIRAEMQENGAPHVILAHTILLLTDAVRQYERQCADALKGDWQRNISGIGAIAASLNYINNHLSESLGVGVLAAQVGMSEGHYARLFHKLVSATPIEYIAARRVEQFLLLMRAEEKNVLEAAFACGFTSASGFYKTFSRICGCAPKEKLRERRYEKGEDHCHENGTV